MSEQASQPLFSPGDLILGTVDYGIIIETYDYEIAVIHWWNRDGGFEPGHTRTPCTYAFADLVEVCQGDIIVSLHPRFSGVGSLPENVDSKA